MSTTFTFPFGELVQPIIQKDRAPKRVFVLGVYASAVHARWIDRQSKTRITALAVASEPYIFWRGDGADEIISRIRIPDAIGKLVPAASRLNGPSGVALDEYFLHPLRLQRSAAWLCDLLPHSCLNPKQKAALIREYMPLIAQYDLPTVTLPPVPRQLADDKRRQEIFSELVESQAETIILLGDEPIRWFLRWFDQRRSKLSDFGTTDTTYGSVHEANIGGRHYQVLPLAHPRQAAKLGSHSEIWSSLHTNWVHEIAHNLI